MYLLYLSLIFHLHDIFVTVFSLLLTFCIILDM